ncbi:MAG: PAS domain S-box protein [Rhodospirillaceae bacterium]|nr:PAS domain S-box protein [Rhodospirillaceae bacterium]
MWRPEVFWLHAGSDALIGLAYFTIPVALYYFTKRRDDLAFPWIFYMFSLFIFACGTTHFFAIWVLWIPDYATEGIVKLITAIVSVGTAIAIWPLMPRALALPGPATLRDINQQLQGKIKQHQRSQAAVERLYEELQISNSTLDVIVQSSPFAIIGLDTSGRITAWNRSAEQMLGYSAAELTGQPMQPLLAGGDQAWRALSQQVERGETRGEVEIDAVAKDGRGVQARVVANPLHDATGALTGTLYFLEDITEKKAMQQQLTQAQRLQAVGQLTGGIAHDFNNLLAVIIGNLDLIQESPASEPKIQRLARQALEASTRGATLIEQLLVFSRRQSLEPEACDVAKLVAETMALMERSLGEHIEIEMSLADDLWPAFADPTQLSTAIANLAINARDAMPQGGRLKIETANRSLDSHYAATTIDVTPGEYVLISISDTGSGMPPEVINRIFEPFFTTKQHGKGSGLGLSMVYGFVKQSKGHVKIYSEVGHGTVVRLYLPRAAQADPLPPLREMPDHGSDIAGSVILLVEDNDHVRDVAKSHLVDLGCEVIETSNARDALDVIASGQPLDLVFTDVVMPGMSGVDLASEARKHRPDLKVLFTSGFAEPAMQTGYWPATCRDFISKPYRRQELSSKLRAVLNGGHAPR